jgi:hypothetical protein
MFAQIILDCQTKKETISCEYCIIKENCRLRVDLKNKIDPMKEPLELMIPLLIKA